MNSESVDLIYLDPPFNSNANYAAPIGSKAAGAEFRDTWSLSDVDAEWINLMEGKHPALYRVLLAATTDSDKSYLAYMAARLLEMKRVLKPTGSIYLHCDPTMSHYLKLVMDAVFGRKAFRNEIAWHYSGWNRRLRSRFNARHDTILFYGGEQFNSYALPWANETEYLKARKQKRHQDAEGRSYVLSDAGGGKRVRRYLDEAMAYGRPVDDVWNIDKINNSSRERTGYPTQKPLALLDRVIKASSNEGDMVLDPFCGCATTCVAAETLGREWAGIDISPKAAELVVSRIREEVVGSEGGKWVVQDKLWREIVHRTDVPRRTDLGRLPHPRTHRNTLYGQQSGYCTGCGEHFKPRHFEVDHIIARSKGGTDHAENLQLLCGACNRVKGDRGMEYLRTRLQLHGK
jgi:site-specific DNA-methyltransferase (adenine-specific)